MLAGLASSHLVMRLGRGRVLRIASFGMAAGVATYTWPGAPLPLSLLGVVIIGFFGSLIVVSVNAFLLAHQGQAGPASLTEANALASLAGLLAPLAVGIAAATFLGWRVGLLVVVLGLIGIEIWRGTSTRAFDAGGVQRTDERQARLPRRVFWTVAFIVCVIGVEFSTVYWSADLLRDEAGFGPAAAAASLVTVTGGMAIGRLVGAKLAQRMPSERLLRDSVLITLAGFILMWVTAQGWVILLGMFVMGLGMSVHWPLGVARAVHASGGMNDRASAITGVFASGAIAVLPFVMGALADAVGVHGAFLVLPVLLVAGLALLLARPESEHSIH